MSRTPEEQKTLDAIAAGQAAGEDVFGDNEELVRDEPTVDTGATTDPDDEAEAKTTTTAEEGEGTTTPADGAATTTEALDEAALQEIADATEREASADPLGIDPPTRFNAEPPKDYKVQRDALTTEKATAMKQLMDGEIDAEQYAAIESGIADKLETLMAQRIRAETLQEANLQNDAAYTQRELRKLAKAVKAEVDYSDPKAAKQFDLVLTAMQADPDNAGRDYGDLIQDVHKTVAAMRGVQTKKADTTTTTTTTSTEAPNRSAGATPPVTLRNLPAAATPNAGGGVLDQMGRLHGPEYEAAFSKLTPQQRAVLLDEA